MFETKERIELLKGELATITDENLRKFCEFVIEKADDYFFEMPASTTGKYHPYYSLGNGGLLRHTRAVVYFMNELVRSQLFDIDEHHRNLLVIAAISHDIKKKGDGSGQHTVKEHPQYASDFLKKCFEEYVSDAITKDDLEYVCKAVETHMGVWGDKKPSTVPEKVLHIADLMASRKDVDVKFISEGIETPKVETVVESSSYSQPDYSNENPNTFVFPFGKFRGKTIAEVEEIDSTYLDWAEKNMTNNPQVMVLIKKYREQKNNII